MSFILHPQLAADTVHVGDLPLCRVLLMNNANFPWLILVPQRAGLCELFDLEPDETMLAMQEIRMVSHNFKSLTGAHKMNIAALGNMVPQLHIHIIARFPEDAAWPNPVWGMPANAYSAAQMDTLMTKIQGAMGLA